MQHRATTTIKTFVVEFSLPHIPRKSGVKEFGLDSKSPDFELIYCPYDDRANNLWQR
jgi:hypothetical protein